MPQYLRFQYALSLDTATQQRLIKSHTCPLWLPDLTFRSRWALQWSVYRYLQIQGYRCELNDNFRRQANIFAILPTIHQLCLESGSSLALASALVTRGTLVLCPNPASRAVSGAVSGAESGAESGAIFIYIMYHAVRFMLLVNVCVGIICVARVSGLILSAKYIFRCVRTV